MTTFALVHSPLVGPSTWEPVAKEMRRAGVAAVVPDLRAAVETDGTLEAVVASAAGQLPGGACVLVGHSGAGVLLPLIARDARAPVIGFVFVDAHLPPARGSVPLADPGFRRLLDALAVDGVLPRWSEWWGEEIMASLVPHVRLRGDICDEMPKVRRSYFDGDAKAASGWTDRPCAYVRLSESYEEQAAMATDMGWPVDRFSAGHLHTVVDPPAVALAIRQVAAASAFRHGAST